MNSLIRLLAYEEIRSLKFRYCRGVDEKNFELLRGVFAEDAVVDYAGALVNPSSGRSANLSNAVVDSIVEPIQGAEEIARAILSAVSNMVTVHHCATGEIEIVSDDTATATWPIVDRLLFPTGSDLREMIGYGFYHDTYERQNEEWKIKTVRMSRTRLDIIRSDAA